MIRRSVESSADSVAPREAVEFIFIFSTNSNKFCFLDEGSRYYKGNFSSKLKDKANQPYYKSNSAILPQQLTFFVALWRKTLIYLMTSFQRKILDVVMSRI
jgi:hypothetical protein